MLNLDDKGSNMLSLGTYRAVFLLVRGRCQQIEEITSFDGKGSLKDEFKEGKEVL